MTSTHSLTPRPIPRLTAHSIHALDQRILQFAPSPPSTSKLAFMKGLASVLDQFSEDLRARKVLPSLLEEVGRSLVFPHRQGLIPVADERPVPTTINPSQCPRDLYQPFRAAIRFASVPPKWLFVVKEPPHNMMALLDCCMGSAIAQSFGSTSCRLCTTH